MTLNHNSGEISRAAGMASLRDYLALTKPRITAMVVLTTLAGFYVGSWGPIDVALLIHTLIGTALVVGSSNALNELIERDPDGLMRRTCNRPLPAGRMANHEAAAAGIAMAVGGLFYLALGVNPLTAILAFAAWFIYVFMYTPLKRKTTLNTIVGAVSGALPPAMGWAAVRNEVSIESLALFAILFFWQLPHFLAIAWMYKEDYARAGFSMLTVTDTDGIRTGRQIVIYGLALIPFSLLPSLFNVAGLTYFVGAFVLGTAYLAFGTRMAVAPTRNRARALLLMSLVYLPALFTVMSLDKPY